MNLKTFTFLLGLTGALGACGPAPTPQQQAARQHEIACLSGTVGGALLGGVIGNQFGGGSGKTILTAAGAAVGGVEGKRFAC
ncbi:glycine zipper 2TM domain-containing protein [Ruegeria faecimaris]|uniref:17 kDa surface antigen n=1 Tax=Ruegeria faecimaris TaxID=686389 RepID=A0A521EDJ1_9RHOB|nr:glycine zipper 2TM domain-containing protein [Ruegeria faecimaris]SMO81984.1 Glycine zipper 2TM domain-containing protein [Ruegeria faecimaris]